MVVFRLHYGLWYTDPDHSLREGSIFCISIGDTEHSSTIQVLVEDTAFIDLQGTKALQQEITFPNGLLQIAGVRFTVARITQGLKNGLFLEHRGRPLDAGGHAIYAQCHTMR